MFCALTLGFAYAIVNPPFAVNDERDHWLRAREISKGRLASRSDAEGPYYLIPRPYYDLILRYGNVQRDGASRVDLGGLLHDLTTPESEPPKWRRRVANASGYSPIPYLPHLPALWVARALNLPALYQVYLSRLSSLICYSLLTAWSIALAGRLAWVFCVLGLMPMALTQAAGLSGDGATNTLSFLFFALLSKGALRAQGSLTRRELFLLGALNVLLTLCKVPYLLTAIALLALSWEGPRAGLRRWAYAGAVMLASALTHGLWVYANRDAATADTAVPQEQLAGVIAHPFGALRVAALTLLTVGDDYLIQLVAFRDLIHRQMRFLGAVVATSYVHLLVAVTWGASFGARPAGRGRDWLAAFLTLSAASGVAAILLAMYLVATPIGAATISGVQGRYFIPLVPALLLAISAYGRPPLARWLARSHGTSVLVMLVILNVLCLSGLVARYYGSAELDWPY